MTKIASFTYGHPYADKRFGVTMIGVNGELHREISSIMGHQPMASDIYRMKKDSGAFFQGGSAGGDWIFIELWHSRDTHPEFVNYLKDIFLKHHPDGCVDGMDLLSSTEVSQVKKVVVVMREAPFHNKRVVNSVHEVPQQLVNDELALKTFAEQICETTRDEFIHQFPEFRAAIWTQVVTTLFPSEM